MTDTTSNRTIVASILFLDIVEYSKQSVTDQQVLKQRFNELLIEALKDVAVNDRIVLDTGDGAAVSFMGTPEDSLFAAMHLRDAVAAQASGKGPLLAVRFGINLGPVRLIKDINGQLNIIGDGINVAQRVMSFADPGIILVSRSYFEVVSRLSDDYAKIFKEAGTRTDKHVREHSVYAIGETLQGNADNAPAPAANPIDASPPAVAPTAPAGPFSKYLLPGGIAIVVIIAIGLGMRPDDKGTAEVAAEPSAPSLKSDKPLTKPAAAKSPAQTRPVAGAVRDRGEPAAPKPAPSSVLLVIRPWGEVYVDGKKKGVSPPLKTLSLTPGTHTIEIRNTTFPAFVKTIDAKPGSQTRIAHKF